ncbi:MAG: hypothetical protein PHX12_05945 [Proteiniphilum sp.]|nr:hypothetical protein [Proteiniphilum sp.]
MEKILLTIKDGYGNSVPSAILVQKDGLLYLWNITCISSRAHGLGNCECVNHPATMEWPISTAEVINKFGVEALDGFEEPGTEQIIFDAFGVEMADLETFCRISYYLGSNPLPILRARTEIPVVFGEEPDLLIFPEEKPRTKVFIVNSHGEIFVREA